jgi:hypothetical protein
MGTELMQLVDQVGNAAVKEQAPSIDSQKLKRYIDRMRYEQDLMMGILGGLAGSAIGTVLWALITLITRYQIGYMAIVVGCLAGFGVRLFGKGIDPVFKYAGAALALTGCLMGSFIVVIVFSCLETGLPVTTLIDILTPSIIVEFYAATFNLTDFLFYALAMSIGYKTAPTTIPKEFMKKGESVNSDQ